MFCWPCCVMLAGTALYIRLLVYAGLSLFIVSGLYVYMVVCVVYAYNLTWGGPEKMAKTGESQMGSVSFLSCCKEESWSFYNSTFKSELFREIFFNFRLVYSQSMSDQFSAHVRPVIHMTL